MTLSNYKTQYSKAKTQHGKQSAYNRAMLNLNHDDKNKFSKWQNEQLNK